MKRIQRLGVAVLVPVALLSLAGCAEDIDETGTPLGVQGQRRTEIEVPCSDKDATDACTQAVAIESADSKDPDVVDVVEFGDGYVLVEGVGDGEATVIAKGDGKRFKIRYEVSGADSADLQVDAIDVQLAVP